MELAHSFGPYKVIRSVGQGGMGAVYLAEAPGADSPVAVKVLPRSFLSDFQFRLRFEREAKAVAQLAGAPVVPIYDYGLEGDQPYIVMPYLTGGTLAARLRQGPLALSEIMPILRRLAEALDVAHGRRIIHRDLKALNVLFDDQGLAYLADFGLSKLHEVATHVSLTGANIMGTPAYMSPEQATGNRPIDHRTDIYALGVLLYEMLTGNLPFTGDAPMQVMYKHVNEPVPPLQVPHLVGLDQWNALLARAMAKDPDQRYPTAGALLQEALHIAELRQPVQQPAASLPTTARHPKADLLQVWQRPTLPGPRASITLLGRKVSRRAATVVGVPVLIAPVLLIALWASISGDRRLPPTPTSMVSPVMSGATSIASPAPALPTLRLSPTRTETVTTTSIAVSASPARTETPPASAPGSATSSARTTQRPAAIIATANQTATMASSNTPPVDTNTPPPPQFDTDTPPPPQVDTDAPPTPTDTDTPPPPTDTDTPPPPTPTDTDTPPPPTDTDTPPPTPTDTDTPPPTPTDTDTPPPPPTDTDTPSP
jgi:serine/threonine-protein kinase